MKTGSLIKIILIVTIYVFAFIIFPFIWNFIGAIFAIAFAVIVAVATIFYVNSVIKSFFQPKN